MEKLYEIASKSCVGDVEIKLITPTYLRALGQSVPNALLVYKKPKTPRVLPVPPSVNSPDSLDLEDSLNLTGAPLECEFDFDDSLCNSVSLIPRHWQKDEALHIPLTFQDASSILSEYNLNCSDNKPLDETVWVVCDGLDPRRIVVMGSHVDADREWFTRSFVSLQDNVARQDLQTYAEDTVKRHCNLTRMPQDEVRYEVTCTYDVFGARNAGDDCNSAQNVEQHGSVVLESTWENTNFRRDVLKPPLEAVTTLDLLVTIGQDTSEAYPLWQQLTLLRQLSDTLTRGEAVLPVGSLTSTDGSVLTRVRELTRSADITPQCWNATATDGDDPATDFADTVTRGRTHEDLTHALWRLTMRCKNVEELADCLKVVFEEVKSGHFVPYIDPENSSRVASEVASLRSGVASLPDLSGLTPLEMLLEIGLETLEKDLLHVLLSSRVATFEQLGYREGGRSLEDRLTWLHRMQCVVEVVLVTQCHLNLPSRSLYPLVAGLLGTCATQVPHYATLRRNHALQFRHPVRTVDVEYHVADRALSGWRLCVSWQGPDRRATTVAHCSTLAVFPPTLSDPGCDDSFRDVEVEDANSFHCCELRTVANKLG